MPLEARRTRLLHRELDGAQLEQLQRRAREHGTTVHGALTAALAIAAGHDHQRRPSHIAIGSPIDFRDELEPPVRPDEVGTYVATVPVVLDIARPFWEVARALTDDLGERRRQGHHFNLVTLVASAAPRCMADARPFMAFMEAEGPINLCSSNIGRYPFPERIGALRLSDAQFLTGISVNGYFVAAINSSHGRLFWNFTYIDEAVPGERAERLAEDCLGTLLSAIHAPNDPPSRSNDMLFTSKPLSPQGRHVLITGASSGLGRETALHLAEQGFQVIAGVRRQEDGERLANACPSGRISTLLIDVTDEESIGRAAAQVAEKVGDTGLWGLVNNAGICISAPLECVSSDLLRRQLEVNLIGQLAVTRAILPLLRRGGAARLVNVTSGLGSVAIPYLGAYSAAQFAKEE